MGPLTLRCTRRWARYDLRGVADFDLALPAAGERIVSRLNKEKIMLRGLKLVHFGGLVIFLGSILTFIVISALIESASLEKIAFGRRIISTGTNVLTLSGMWVLAIAGVWMGYKRYGLKQRFSSSSYCSSRWLLLTHTFS